MNIQPRIILSKEVSEDMLRHIFSDEYEVLFDKPTNTFTLIFKEEEIK